MTVVTYVTCLYLLYIFHTPEVKFESLIMFVEVQHPNPWTKLWFVAGLYI